MSLILTLLKRAAPVYEEQKDRDVPEKVIEIANAIRRDDPTMTDEAAYRIAWARYKGQEPGEPKEPYEKNDKRAPDPNGIRTKLREDGEEREGGARGGEDKSAEFHRKLSMLTTSGFLYGLLADTLPTSMEKTANHNQVYGIGHGMADAIDALIKGGSVSIDDMLERLASMGRIDNPEAVRKVQAYCGKGSE